jgi:hypothetical protein
VVVTENKLSIVRGAKFNDKWQKAMEKEKERSLLF